MKKLCSLFLFVAVPAFAGGLRLFNPTAQPVEVSVACDGVVLRQTIVAQGIGDFFGDNCRVPVAPQLLALHTDTIDDVDLQTLDAAPNADCPTPALQLPLTGCRFGSAVAAVTPIDGATYSWAIDGGTLLSGAGSERILIAIGSGLTLKVTAVVTSPSCGAQSAAGIMALRDPFTIKSLNAGGSGAMGQPRTITWAYDNGTPASQTLIISDVGGITLPASARSYTYTPALWGDKSVVLQASSTAAVAAGRTRAAGRGTVAASNCTSARAEAKYHVDCTAPAAQIDAPAATGVGIAFTARVKLAPGTSAAWTITNGTPATASGDAVTIQPLGTAPVDISVTVSADTCTNTAATEVAVDPKLGCATPPSAKLTIAPLDCNHGVITVSLTGTPPFSGTWSDGAPFAATDRTVQRSVTTPGDYTIKNLRDALCSGQSNSVKYVAGPAATVSTNGVTCLGGSADSVAVVTFAGTPPFLGEWSDSVAFNTTSTRLERTITSPVDLTLKWFQDANCPGTVTGHASFGTQGTANLTLAAPANGCLMIGDPSTPYATASVDLTGTPPFTVEWSDGFEQTAAVSPMTRALAPPPGAAVSLAITSARDANCDLKLLQSSVNLGVTRYPVISAPAYICPNGTYTAYVTNVWSSASFSWRIDHGQIIDGQATQKVTFRPNSSETKSVTLYIDAVDPNTCTATGVKAVNLYSPPGPVKVSVSPSTIALGQSTTVTVSFDPKTTNFAQANINSPSWQYIGSCNGGGASTCSFTLTPKTAGTLQIFGFAVGLCDQYSWSTDTTTLVVQ